MSSGPFCGVSFLSCYHLSPSPMFFPVSIKYVCVSSIKIIMSFKQCSNLSLLLQCSFQCLLNMFVLAA
jgi:hypothetical protein